MRRFHLLSHVIGRTNLHVVIDANIQSLNTNVFLECKPYVGELPSDVKLIVAKGEIADCLPNGQCLTIVSGKLLGIIRAYSDDFQAIEAPVFEANSGRRIEGYFILNVLRCLQAVDVAASKTSYMDFPRYNDIPPRRVTHFIKLAFREALIPRDVHLFKPVESSTRVVISDELAKAMVGKVQGVALVRTKTV